MALQVFESNRIEQLFALLCRRLRDNQQGILHPNQFVITCFGMEQWLLKSLANELGVFVNGQFDFPINFVRRLGALLSIETDEFYQIEVLRFRVLSLLQESTIASKLEELDETLFHYLYHQSDDLKTQRLWQTAQSLAQIFDSYQWQRVEWLQLWQKNYSAKVSESLAVREAIQAMLWRGLLAQKSVEVNNLPRHRFIEKIITTLDEGIGLDALEGFKNGVTIWGVLPLMPPVWQVIQSLSKHIQVDFYFLNPSLELWGENLYLPFVEERLKQREVADTLFYQHHPLLMATGQIGAQCQKQLLDRPEISIESCFVEPNPEQTLNLLARVKSDVLYDIPQSELEPIELLSGDESLQIHRCPNRQTELKKLHNEIISWLHEDRSRQWDEVLVLAPNMADYMNWLPVIFSKIPFSSPSMDHQDGLHEAFGCLLEMMNDDKPLSIEDLNDFFAFSVVQKKCQESRMSEQVNGFLDSLYEVGFRWGITDEQRRSHYFEKGLSLEGALDLLWVRACADHQWELTQWSQYQLLHRYVQKIVFMYREVHSTPIAAAKKSVTHWLDRWMQWLRTMLISGQLNEEQKEYERLISVFNRLKQNVTLANFSEPVAFFSMVSLWRDSLSETVNNTHYLSGKMVFANLLDMHAVPFKFIAVMGLDERYSRFDNQPLLDLTWQLPAPYDRSAEANNNNYFLECLQVVGERLWLSYSIDSGSNVINPSMPLSALLDYIHSHVSNTELLKQVVFEHEDIYVLTDDAVIPKQGDEKPVAEHHAQKVTELSKSLEKNLLYSNQLAARLINPMKVFVHSCGGKSTEVMQAYNRYEASSLSPLERALWRVKLTMTLLTEEGEKQAQLSLDLAENISQDAGFLSSDIIMQELEEEMKRIRQQLNEILMCGAFTQAVQPMVYRAKHEGRGFTLCAQPQIIAKDGESRAELGQVFVSGGQRNLQKLLQLWLNHLVLNTGALTPSTYLCFEKKGETLKLSEIKLPAVTQQQAKQKIQEIIGLNHEIEASPIWAPQNMTFAMAKMTDEELRAEKNKVDKIFYAADERSEWLALLNDYRVYDLSYDNKTWQDSLTYAKKLWGKWQ